MSHNFGKVFLSGCALLIASNFSTFAQNSNRENSPYTRYGLGDSRNGVNPLLKGMASASSAYSNSFAVNTDNPASYAHLLLTTYEAGGEGSRRTIHRSTDLYRTGMATLTHLNIGIPIGKNVGVAFGLKPFSRTYYRLADTTIFDGLGKTAIEYTGDGSTNYAFIGGAYAYKGLSIGVNFGYLFGNYDYRTVTLKLTDSINAMNSDFIRYHKVGGIHWRTGLLYETSLNKKLAMRIGATATLAQSINIRQDDYQIAWRSTGGGTVADTAVSKTGNNGTIQLPATYTLGMQLFNGGSWTAAVDFSASNWSAYRQFGQRDSLGNAWRLAVGGEFTPSTKTINATYLSRVTYRLGAYYGHDKVLLQNTEMNYVGLTAGLSLPFRRSFDRLHLAADIGRRGQETKGLIRENYFRFSVGISLNDRWFIKRRYD